LREFAEKLREFAGLLTWVTGPAGLLAEGDLAEGDLAEGDLAEGDLAERNLAERNLAERNRRSLRPRGANPILLYPCFHRSFLASFCWLLYSTTVKCGLGSASRVQSETTSTHRFSVV
jgi:hypothetical protein